VSCSELQCVAEGCSELQFQCDAVCCSTRHRHLFVGAGHEDVCCHTLQLTAIHCSSGIQCLAAQIIATCATYHIHTGGDLSDGFRMDAVESSCS